MKRGGIPYRLSSDEPTPSARRPRRWVEHPHTHRSRWPGSWGWPRRHLPADVRLHWAWSCRPADPQAERHPPTGVSRAVVLHKLCRRVWSHQVGGSRAEVRHHRLWNGCCALCLRCYPAGRQRSSCSYRFLSASAAWHFLGPGRWYHQRARACATSEPDSLLPEPVHFLLELESWIPRRRRRRCFPGCATWRRGLQHWPKAPARVSR